MEVLLRSDHRNEREYLWQDTRRNRRHIAAHPQGLRFFLREMSTWLGMTRPCSQADGCLYVLRMRGVLSTVSGDLSPLLGSSDCWV
jgi:hypothetical protein